MYIENWEGMHHVDINGNCLFLKDDTVAGIKEILLKIIEKDTLKELKQKAQIAAASFRYSEIAQKAIGM